MTALTFDLLHSTARWADRTAATKLIPCSDCGGSGRISYSHGNDPSPRKGEWCMECSGYGEREVEIEEPNP